MRYSDFKLIESVKLFETANRQSLTAEERGVANNT